MYSPKISPDLIPVLYHEAKSRRIPMTRLVNRLLSDSLASQQLSPDAVEALKATQTLKQPTPPAIAA